MPPPKEAVGDKKEYIVILHKQLKANEETEIILKWEIEDITNAPFLIQSYGSCEGIEHARYVIIFPQGQLRNIESSKEISHSASL